MEITLTMLLDLALPGHAFIDEAIPSKSPGAQSAQNFIEGERAGKAKGALSVRGIRIFGNAKAAEDENNSDLLFIKKQAAGVLFICGGKKIPFETDLSFAEVFNKLEETFIMLRDWDMQLHQCIIEKKGLQYIIDVSEDIFRRPIAVTDSGHKLIAYSKRWHSGDPIFHSLVDKGYLPADAIDKLDRAGFILEKEAIVFRKGIDGISWPMLNGTIFVGQDYRYMLTMLFPKGDITDGVYDLFAFLRNQLTLYVETNSDASRIRRFAWMSLLADLVEGKCGPEEFAERNSYSGLPEGRAYRLVSLRRKDGAMREFIRDKLEQALPEEVVFVHGDNVLVILPDKQDPGAPESGPLQKLAPLIADSYIFVCISNRFESMTDLHSAYTQIRAAYELGLRITENRTLEKLGVSTKAYDENIFRYSDYYPYDLISDSAYKLTAGAAGLFPAFKTLLADDEKSGAGNLRLLYAYLKNDCSKTRTAAELFMHRNNIIYRIGKLEESLSLSLADEQVKTAFRLSFLALELLALDM